MFLQTACSQTNTASRRLPSQGEFIKRTLKTRERIRQLIRDKLLLWNYMT